MHTDGKIMGPTYIEINHAHLAHNFRLVKDSVYPAKVMAVVKADAYGHGSIEAAQTLVQNGADFLAVAFIEEGIVLREAGINTPILVFGAQLPRFFEKCVQHDLQLTITSLEQLTTLENICRENKRTAHIHLKIDTGMNRVGFYDTDFKNAFQMATSSGWIRVEGVYSHLSSADEEDSSYTLMQLERFKEIETYIKKNYKNSPLFHIANSAAIMRFPKARLDMVRPGVMLYGNPPSPTFKTDWELREVMRFRSEVALVKEVPKGAAISYNRRYHAESDTKIAVIPVGYADGFNRRMTNTGHVLIRGKKYPIIGTVCMDQFLVHLGKNSDIRPGEEVVLFGQQENGHIRITEVSQQLNTIPYEVTCWPSARVKRYHRKQTV